MADKIYSIQGVLPNSYSVPPVRGYTESERTEKLKQIEQQIKDREELMADRKEIREKYPNPKAVVIVHLYGTPAKIEEIVSEEKKTKKTNKGKKYNEKYYYLYEKCNK